MSKIKKASDLLIREAVLKLIIELYGVTKDKKIISGYKIAKILDIETGHALDYLRRWEKHGLLISTIQKEHIYFSLNPDFFRMGDDTVSFDIDGIEVTLKGKPTWTKT